MLKIAPKWTGVSLLPNNTGLDIVPAEDKNGRRCSLCKTCGTITLRNQTARWRSHAQSCSGLKATIAPLSAAAQRLVVQCPAGGERHLHKLCDGYIVAFWLYKHKLSFVMGPKILEVMLCLHFLDTYLAPPRKPLSNSLFYVQCLLFVLRSP